MSRTKYYRALSVLCLLLALGSYGLYEWRGASVDSQGALQESFGLVPTAWLFFAAGVWYALRYRGANARDDAANQAKD